MAQQKKHYRVTIYNMNCGLGKNGKPTETEEVTVCARNQAEAERLAVSGGLTSSENGWGAWDSVEVDGKGHRVTPKKAKTTTKTATKKLTGKAREEKSVELFMNILEYNLLGFRIGDGLYNMFNTLVTSISKKKMEVLPDYHYDIAQGNHRAMFKFKIRSATGTYTVYASADREDHGNSRLVLVGAGKTQFPFSEKGVREIVKTIRAAK